MKYLHFPITASTGDTVVVSLDSQANVRLLDPINYSKYRRGERHEFYGGSRGSHHSGYACHAPESGMWPSILVAMREPSALEYDFSPSTLQ